MIRRLYFYLLTAMLFLTIASCSNDNGTEKLIEDKLQMMSGKEMIRELLIKNDNDVNQLSRIFDCSPSSIKRILNGETIPTSEAKNQFKNILNVTLITKEKTLNNLDPKYQSWQPKLKHLIESNFISLTIIIVVLVILGFAFPSHETGIFSSQKSYPLLMVPLVLLLLVVVIYFIVLIFGWFSTETIYIDYFKNTYDPIWEILK